MQSSHVSLITALLAATVLQGVAQTPPIIMSSSPASPIQACFNDGVYGVNVPVTMSVSVMGTPPMEWQWRHNGAFVKSGLSTSGSFTTTHTLSPVSQDDAGTWTCIVDNVGATSTTFTVNVYGPITLLTLTASNTTPCVGEAVTLTATVQGGTPNPTFMWEHLNVWNNPLEGGSTWVIPAVTAADSGTWQVYVVDSCTQNQPTASVVLDVQDGPTVTIAASNLKPCIGGGTVAPDSVTFTATATGGTPPYAYHWAGPDGVWVDGGATLTIQAVTLADEGLWSVKVEDALCTSAPASVAIDVRVPPTVTLSASNTDPCQGDTVVLTATITGDPLDGPPPSFYIEWSGPGGSYTAGGTTHTIAGISPAQSGLWSVRVYGYCSPTAEASIAINVKSAPTVTLTASNLKPCLGSASLPADWVTFTATVTGTGPFTYHWAGPTGVWMDGGPTWTIAGVTLADEGVWSVKVNNEWCPSATASVTIDVKIPPTVTLAASDTSPCEGDNVVLTATITGDPFEGPPPFFSIEWAGPGMMYTAGGATYTIQGITPAQSGWWSVRVYGFCSPTATAEVQITVHPTPLVAVGIIPAPPCVGEAVALAIVTDAQAPYLVDWMGPTTGGFWVPGGDVYGIPAATLAHEGQWAARVTDAYGCVGFGFAWLDVKEPPQIVLTASDTTPCVGDLVTLTVQVVAGDPLPAFPGFNFEWSGPSNGFQWTPGGPTKVFPAITTADSGTWSVKVHGLCPPPAIASVALDVRTPPIIESGPGNAFACVGDPAAFQVTVSGSPPLIIEWSGPRTGGAWVAGGTTYALFAVALPDAGVYSVRVSNECGVVTAQGTLTVGVAPDITSGPSNVQFCQGASATLAVTATGTPAPTFEWRRNGVLIPGATGSSLVVTQEGTYAVTAINICGTDSASAVATLLYPPVIIDQPDGRIVCPGETVALSVVAIGSWPLTYLWHKNGVPIAGANSSTYFFGPASSADAGVYHVVVGNVCGLVSSVPALISLSTAHARHWSAVGALAPAAANATVRALATGYEGGTPVLYAGGTFTTATGALAEHVARWDGTAWTQVGSGFNGQVNALVMFDDGTGSALYASGAFTSSGSVATNRVAKWNGVAWTAVGSGLGVSGGQGMSLCVYDDGAGPALYAGGGFNGGPGPQRLARWDGTTWTTVGGADPNGAVNAMAVHDDGTGPQLYVGGSFTDIAGTGSAYLAKWNGVTWSAVPGFGQGGAGAVYALLSFDDGPGNGLFVGGSFTDVGGSNLCRRIAKLTGAVWSPLATGFGSGTVFALKSWDDGDGPGLYLGGSFTTAASVNYSRIARWRNGAFTQLDSGMDLNVRAFEAFAPGGSCGDLYVGGNFTTAGGIPAVIVARWAPDFTLRLSQAYGPGSLTMFQDFGPPAAAVFTAISFDVANSVTPGAGPWFGLFVDDWTLYNEFITLSPPFVVLLDGVGRSSFVLPAGTLAFLAGTTFWSNSGTFDPLTLTPGTFTAVESLTVQ